MGNERNTVKIVAVVIVIAALAGAGLYSIYSINDGSLDLKDREVRLVVSSSMDGEKTDYEIPTIPLNSLIMIKLLDESEHGDIEIGDVITFKRGGKLIVHRVVEIEEIEGSGYKFITKGDANLVVDSPVYSDMVAGKVTGLSLYAGKLVAMSKSHLIWGVLLIALAIVIVYSVRDIIQIQRNKNDNDKP